MTVSAPDRASFHLTDDERARFDRDGFIGPFDVYPPDEIERLWRRERFALMDRSAAVYGEEAAESGNTNISNYDRHLDSDFLADHIRRPEIVHRVMSILGPDVLCWRTEFFPKYPGDEGTDWHQAATFANPSGRPQLLWPDDCGDFGGCITVWTGFTPATEENGCLQVIPATHRTMNYDESRAMQYRPELINARVKHGTRRGFFGYDYRELQRDPDFVPDESNAVSLTLEPGQAVMFWSTLMHASFPHTGATREMRLGFAARYVPTSVRIYPDTDEIAEYGGRVSLERYGAVLVSGENRFPHNRVVAHTTSGRPLPHVDS